MTAATRWAWRASRRYSCSAPGPGRRSSTGCGSCCWGAFPGFFAYALTQAYRLTDATTLAPFEYVALPTAIVLGWLVFDHIPDPWVLLGCALIAGSGVYVYRRRKKLGAGRRRLLTAHEARARIRRHSRPRAGASRERDFRAAPAWRETPHPFTAPAVMPLTM